MACIGIKKLRLQDSPRNLLETTASSFCTRMPAIGPSEAAFIAAFDRCVAGGAAPITVEIHHRNIGGWKPGGHAGELCC